MLIAVDFDGTIVEHEYPKIGKEIPFAIDTLIALANEGHRIVLWTVREGQLLTDAVEFCSKRGLEFYAVNSDSRTGSLFEKPQTRKLRADVYIDDRNIGGIPDWGAIYETITGMQLKREAKRRKHRRFSLFGGRKRK